MGKIYGYIRCSTDETKQDISRQEREVKQLINENVDYIYREFESGSKEDRKELQQLLSIVAEGDTIVCTEVSRITRSTKQLCEIIELSKNKKLKIVFGNFEVDCTKDLNPMTEGMIKMMGVFAEIERNIISERVKSGMANAKEKGKQIGRKAITVEDIPKSFLNHYKLFEKGKINKSELARITQLSRVTVDKYLKLLGHTNKSRK